MTRWVVIFKDTEAMLTVRADKTRRDAHVAYAQNHPELLVGGGLKSDPDSAFCGALWIVEANSKSDVVGLVENDPFFEPVYRRYEIYTWGKILEEQTVLI